jgi:hypothetical protein
VGASGESASSVAVTEGSGSYSTAIGSAASFARSTLSATTKATGSPTSIVRSFASAGRDGTNIAEPSRRWRGMTGRGAPKFSAAQSAPVSTASTPGIRCAKRMSIERMRACACGERRT